MITPVIYFGPRAQFRLVSSIDIVGVPGSRVARSVAPAAWVERT